ncbi:hypothetical protein V5799_017765 [Amblyomma americanum]|uniref:Peptidase M13 N-terminal domain-containing protein n=1 Tax=Amblyomma americanum TaxID=6943 RepID=A0AAQ4F164_AMBAM
MAACGVGMMTALLLCLVLLVAMGQSSPSPVRRCTAHSCVVAQLDLVQLLDGDVDPCRDLYGHVCRKWEEAAAPGVTKENVIDGGTDYLRASRARFLRDLNRTLLEAAKSRPSAIHLRPVYQFYSHCVNFASFQGGVPIAAILEAFQSDAQSIADMTDFRSAVKWILTLSLTRSVHTLLSARLMTADGGTLLVLFPGETLVEKLGATVYSEDKQEYLSFVFEHACKHFPAVVGHRPSLERVLNMDRVILTLVPHPSSGTRKKSNIIVVKELCQQLRTYDWIKLLNAHVTSSRGKFSYKSQVLISEWESLISIVRYLEGLGDLLLISIYLYLHVLVDSLKLDYHRRLGFKNPESLIEVCLRATQEAVAYAWSIVVRDLEETGEYDVTQAFDLPQLLQLGIADENHATLLGQRSNEAVRRFLGRVSVHSYDLSPHVSQVGFHMAAFSYQVTWVVTSFPAAYSRLRALKALLYLSNPPSEADAEASEAFLGEQVVYVTRLDLLVVPGHLRRRPLLYSKEVPLEFSIGSLGFLTAQQLYRATLTPVPESRTSAVLKEDDTLLVSKFEDCLKIFFSRLLNASESGRGSRDTRRNTSEPSPKSATMLPTGPAQGELFFASSGLALAYRALRSALSRRHRSASNWYQLWTDAQRTFFRRYCLMACASSSFPGPVDPRLHCALPLATMDEFSWAFGCSSVVPDFGRCLLV